MENSPDSVVITQGLSKSYGDTVVVDNLNLRIPAGSIYGFLGPNGSGKTTTMKMILGLTRPTKGRVTVLGREMNNRNRRQILPQVGSLIENPPGYAHLTGAENMDIQRHMLGLEKAACDRALEVVALTRYRGRQVRTYSLGMKQRLGVAFALAREPRLLVLDEPINGLDPAGIEEIRALLIRLAGEGVSIMISSHILAEIERIADRIAILARGRLLFEGSRTELMRRSVPDTVFTTSEGEQRVADLDDARVATRIRELVDVGVDIYEVRREKLHLEDIFRDLTSEALL